MKTSPERSIPITILLTLVACGPAEEGATADSAASTARPEVDEPAAEAPSGPLSFVAQEGWVEEEPTSSMRKAQYALPAVEGDEKDAQLVVYHFGSGAGSLEANLSRWASQFEQPDGSSSSEAMEVSTRVVAGRQATVARLSGTFRAETRPGSGQRVNEPDYRMIAAVVDSDVGPYYCKLVGPSATVTHWEASFQRFLGAIH